MKYALIIVLITTALTACSREEGPKEPGGWLRPGGDVVIQNH